MKKTAKISSLVLSLSILLTACASQAPSSSSASSSPEQSSATSQAGSPFQAYQSIMQSFQEASSIEAKTEHTVELTRQGESSQLYAAAVIKQLYQDDSVQFEVLSDAKLDDDVDGRMESYYLDGYLYLSEPGAEQFKMPMDEAVARAQLESAVPFFTEKEILSSSQQAQDAQTQLKFSLSPELMKETVQRIAITTMNNLGAMMDGQTISASEFIPKTFEYEILLDENAQPVNTSLHFEVDIVYEGDTLQIDCTTKMSDFQLNAIDSILFPEDLAGYRDPFAEETPPVTDSGFAAEEGNLPTLGSDENRFVHIASAYQVDNTFGDNCYAALFLESNADMLDSYFWVAFQTQSGSTAPANPAGFTSPSNISTEGLLRLFCFLNEYQLNAFSDPAEKILYIPDSLIPLSLDNFLEGYTYDPATLPAAFNYSDGMLKTPFQMVQPAANLCRIDLVEVTASDRLRITATGLDKDGQTPRNTQQLELKIRDGGNASYLSYTIKPL